MMSRASPLAGQELIRGFLSAMTALKLVLLMGRWNRVHAFGGASEQQGVVTRAGVQFPGVQWTR